MSTMLKVNKVPVAGPRAAGGIAWLLGVGVVGSILLIAGMWPFALVLYVGGVAAFFIHVDRGWKKRRANIEAAGIEDPDYTAWETTLSRRVALSATAVLLVMVVGLLVLAIFVH